MTVGKRILKLRKEETISQEVLADKINVSRQSISKWEQDLVIPDMENIISLSKLFNVSVDYLVYGKENNKNYKINFKDYIVLTIGLLFIVLIGVILIIDPDSLLETSSVIYLNGLWVLLAITFILIIIGVLIVYRSKRNEK